MDPLASIAFIAVSLLPSGLAFDENALGRALVALPGEREGERPFARLTPELLRTALEAAADAGLVREVEIEPGRFLMVRTEARPEPPLSGYPREISELSSRIDVAQPAPDQLDRALQVSVGTVALRRAILSPAIFVWRAEDYAALLAAAQRLPETER